VQVRFHHRLGLLLIIGSGGIWVAIFLIPILPWAHGLPSATVIAQKALLTTSLIVMSEVIFWLGILLTGKELAHRYHRKLNPYYWWKNFTKR
jgi:hypothetical protein